uniref:FAM192A_Fyv6_N domain-containing protein n=1 Tax=Parastrongyloides trichosuri TaxID=131310 RepID=A0A0N4ZAQ4_PARTI
MLRYLRIKRREERPYDREETLEEMDEREESGWDSSAYEKRIEEADDKAYEEVEAIQRMIEERKIACELNPVTLEIEEEAEPPIKKMKTED